MGGSGSGNRVNRVNLGHFVMSERKMFSKIDMKCQEDIKLYLKRLPLATFGIIRVSKINDGNGL